MRGFRTTSGRRPARRAGVSAWAIATVLGLAAVVALVGGLREHRPAPVPEPTAVPGATRSPTATPTATPELLRRSLTFRLPVPTVPSPTPTATLAPPPPEPTRPPPSPTPGASDCLRLGFTTSQVVTPSAQVLVQVDAVNRCGRNFEPNQLWFRITGFRDGDPVRTVGGQPFHRLRRRGSVQVAIGLPGSADWYDHIAVEVLDRAP